jgi:hypothetical protein
MRAVPHAGAKATQRASALIRTMQRCGVNGPVRATLHLKRVFTVHSLESVAFSIVVTNTRSSPTDFSTLRS